MSPAGGDRRGRLIVVSGPSGVGKGTVVRRVLPRLPGARLSVSVTTRPPRPGETDGVDYRFVGDAEFDRMVERGELLEWAHVHCRRYGTPQRWVEEQRETGHDVLAELDVQGALQVRDRVGDAVLVFLAPPSRDELARRLARRGTEAPQDQAARLDTAEIELAAAPAFDHVVVNDELESCVEAVVGILTGRGGG